jgi:hypothetical protein
MANGKRDPSSHRTPAQIKKMDRGYNSTDKMIEHRSMNNEARALMAKKGLVHKGDGLDVDHKKGLRLGGGNDPKNLRVLSQKRNRGWERNPSGKA